MFKPAELHSPWLPVAFTQAQDYSGNDWSIFVCICSLLNFAPLICFYFKSYKTGSTTWLWLYVDIWRPHRLYCMTRSHLLCAQRRAVIALLRNTVSYVTVIGWAVSAVVAGDVRQFHPGNHGHTRLAQQVHGRVQQTAGQEVKPEEDVTAMLVYMTS